jgi:RND family efflux transporter MFP subunit
MKKGSTKWRTLLIVAVLLPLGALFFYVMMNSGPFAPISVTVTEVESREISPALYGIGVVDSRAIHRIGATSPGRLLRLDVHVGDRVAAGQALGAMDPVDMKERIEAQTAGIRRLKSVVAAADARVSETAARKEYADGQARRYENLLKTKAVSVEAADAKRQERLVTSAAWSSARADAEAARAEQARAEAELKGLLARKEEFSLVSPVDGLVASREAEPGSTVVAGQTVIQVVDTEALWISVRFDQASSSGLQAGLPVDIVLRSRPDEVFPGSILRIEPLADAVTEELLAKAVFEKTPSVLPPLGELAEVTVRLPALAKGPVVPDASLQRFNGRIGVWTMKNGSIAFRPVTVGRRDLNGFVRILEGLSEGERVVVYSMKALTPRSRVKVVERLGGADA